MSDYHGDISRWLEERRRGEWRGQPASLEFSTVTEDEEEDEDDDLAGSGQGIIPADTVIDEGGGSAQAQGLESRQGEAREPGASAAQQDSTPAETAKTGPETRVEETANEGTTNDAVTDVNGEQKQGPVRPPSSPAKSTGGQGRKSRKQQ
jgi:hypothetical protein